MPFTQNKLLSPKNINFSTKVVFDSLHRHGKQVPRLVKVWIKIPHFTYKGFDGEMNMWFLNNRLYRIEFKLKDSLKYGQLIKKDGLIYDKNKKEYIKQLSPNIVEKSEYHGRLTLTDERLNKEEIDWLMAYSS